MAEYKIKYFCGYCLSILSVLYITFTFVLLIKLIFVTFNEKRQKQFQV